MKHSSVPAYSIGKKFPVEPITTNKLSPSPNLYNTRKEEILVPTASFGKAARSLSAPKTNNPGPGSYNINSFVDKKPEKKKRKTLKILKDKNEKPKIETPGPASYNPSKPKTQIAYSIGNKTFSLNDSEDKKIGPGHYSPNINAVKPVKTSTIPKASKDIRSVSVELPGPGFYEVPIIKESPNYIFSKEKKDFAKVFDYPAPGRYNVSEDLKNKIGKTIVPRRPLITKDSDNPGPGAYNVKLPSSNLSFSVGRGKRAGMTTTKEIPGPGQYSPIDPSHTTIAKSIGTSKRPEISKFNNFPGPGTYDSKSFVSEGPKHSMLGRKTETKNNVEPPGPGYYNPNINAVKPDTVHPVIGTGQRISEGKKEIKTFPGPGAYDVSFSKDSPKWTFKKDPKEKVSYEDEPGPGQYDIPTTIPDVPKYLVSKNKK